METSTLKYEFLGKWTRYNQNIYNKLLQSYLLKNISSMDHKHKQTVKDLRRWATFLRTQVPEGNFRMESWKWGTSDLSPKHMDGTCGTTACAAGWATAIPAFRRRGLFLSGCVRPDFIFKQGRKKFFGTRGVAEFFHIDYAEAALICDPSAYRAENPRVATVASRIERLAERLEA